MKWKLVTKLLPIKKQWDRKISTSEFSTVQFVFVQCKDSCVFNSTEFFDEFVPHAQVGMLNMYGLLLTKCIIYQWNNESMNYYYTHGLYVMICHNYIRVKFNWAFYKCRHCVLGTSVNFIEWIISAHCRTLLKLYTSPSVCANQLAARFSGKFSLQETNDNNIQGTSTGISKTCYTRWMTK